MNLTRDHVPVPLMLAGLCSSALIAGASQAVAASGSGQAPDPGIHAFRLYTGADGDSHVQEGHVSQGADFPAVAVKFEATPPHSPSVWHNDPQPQYVVTMTGTLKFSTRSGEGFVLRPGDVLIAEDSTGSGHGWELLGDAPWTRTYAILPPDHRSAFVATGRNGGGEP